MYHQVTADQQNENLEIGRFIDKTSYSRGKKRVYLADVGAKIDMIFEKNGEHFIVEIKKSSKKKENAEKQLKYYLYLLLMKGKKFRGILRFPTERKSINVDLSENDIKFIEENLEKIEVLLQDKFLPIEKRTKLCPKCAHFEFCWS